MCQNNILFVLQYSYCSAYIYVLKCNTVIFGTFNILETFNGSVYLNVPKNNTEMTQQFSLHDYTIYSDVCLTIWDIQMTQPRVKITYLFFTVCMSSTHVNACTS